MTTGRRAQPNMISPQPPFVNQVIREERRKFENEFNGNLLHIYGAVVAVTA